MTDDKNVTLEQFIEFAHKVDERMDNLEIGKVDKVSPVSITIPVSAWTENTDTATKAAGFAFYADTAVEGLAAEDSTDTVLDYASLEPAKACGMAGTSTPMAAAIRHYAARKPTTALTATLRVFKAKPSKEESET